MGKHMIPFSTVKEEERQLIELAFSKKKADDRKEWLRQLKVGEHEEGLSRTDVDCSLYSRELISTMILERSPSQTLSTKSSSCSPWRTTFDRSHLLRMD